MPIQFQYQYPTAYAPQGYAAYPNYASYPTYSTAYPAYPAAYPVSHQSTPLTAPISDSLNQTLLKKPLGISLPRTGFLGKTVFSLKHPLLALNLWKNQARFSANTPSESPSQQWAMVSKLADQLNAKDRALLIGQMRNGRLFNANAEDRASALAHLYQIASTPRANGIDGKQVLHDVMRLMCHPESITQRFAPLHPSYEQAILGHVNKHVNSGFGLKLQKPATSESFSDYSATCVSASVMYTLFDKQPSEAIRHIAELTSPKLAFTEQAKASEIAPDAPTTAAQKLAQYAIPYRPLGNNRFDITVAIPKTGLIRALNQQNNPSPNAQSLVESIYQGALTKLAAFNYEPGLGTLILPDGTLDKDPGIMADQKTLMESLIKDSGAVSQVEYQVTAADRNNEPYLMGYLRPFEKTYSDLVNAINKGHHVVIGIVETDKNGPQKGRLNLKHEVTVVGHKNGIFDIADSDDDVPHLIQKSAQELIPQIHHAGLPASIGSKVQAEMNTLSGRYLTPDQNDAMRFKLQDTVPPAIQPQFLADFQQRQMQELAQQQALQANPYAMATPLRQGT